VAYVSGALLRHGAALPMGRLVKNTWRWVRRFGLCPGRFSLLHDEIRAGRNVLFEGAHGVLLDLDHGTIRS